MKIGLIPLDERPVNTHYPEMIAAIAGVEVVLPPKEILSAQRRAADCEGIQTWLENVAAELDGLIVSVEMLGYGGLVASRISGEGAGTILARLDSLRRLKKIPVFVFNVITRVSNADDAIEEPEYWAHYGLALYRYSQFLDRQAQGEDVSADLKRSEEAVPVARREDFLRRRMRNHTVNLGVLQMLAEGAFDLLVLSSDDTSPHGLPAGEKRWLATWAERLNLEAKILMYPGADEVGCVLLARMLHLLTGKAPHFLVKYAPTEGAENVAAYEDGPVRVTVERQVMAAGGHVVEAGEESAGDLWLGVNAPVARRSEWHPDFAMMERAVRFEALQSLAIEAGWREEKGQAVLIADVAYPNGADPALMEVLRQKAKLTELTAYGAWNTAGNTIGTVLAQGCAAQFIRTDAQQMAQERFLVHRLVEDWGYQQIVRSLVREELKRETGKSDPDANNLNATTRRVESELQTFLTGLAGFGERWRIKPGSVRLPWKRLFEVDFDLEWFNVAQVAK